MQPVTAASKRLYACALLLFLATATAGTMLRYIYLGEIPGITFRPLLHAHSHVAMLGWVFPGLVLLYAVGRGQALRTVDRWLLSGCLAAALGMLITFPMGGYWAASVAFTMVHLLLSYAVLARVYQWGTGSLSNGFFRWAIIWYFVSTVGIWALGPIMTWKIGPPELYYLAVQFFLHFQFMGWFTLASWGLLLLALERHAAIPKRLGMRRALAWLVSSVPLTFFLVLLWANRHWSLNLLTALGVLVQLVANFLLIWALWPALRGWLPTLPRVRRILIANSIVSLLVKVLVQAAVAIPAVAVMSFTIRNYVVGFLHLITLGGVSLLAIALADAWDLRPVDNPFRRWGALLLLAGFLGTELLLFGQGTLFWLAWGFLPGYQIWLFGTTLLMPLGILLLVITPNRHASER